MVGRALELAGVGALGGLLKRKSQHAPAPGALCANCGTELKGLYCHACGQSADDHHRSIWHLLWEGIESLTHLDGRLAQTLPLLFVAPGKLARDHFEGRRQRHVPPFRLFLVSLLLFMLVLEALFHGGADTQVKALKPGGSATLPGDGGAVTVTSPGGVRYVPLHPPAVVNGRDETQVHGKQIFEDANGEAVDQAFDALRKDGKSSPFTEWLRPRLRRAIDDKELYTIILFTWAHRLAILLLPILAGLLALVYARSRLFYFYDHLIVSMQFLSFVFLISALAWILPSSLRDWAVLAASIWVPINLYQTLRGGYGSRRWAAALKTLFLWCSTLVLFGVLMVELLALALAAMA